MALTAIQFRRESDAPDRFCGHERGTISAALLPGLPWCLAIPEEHLELWWSTTRCSRSVTRGILASLLTAATAAHSYSQKTRVSLHHHQVCSSALGTRGGGLR